MKGIISLQNVDRENTFGDSDVRLLTTRANSMSVALENARLFDETSRHARESAALNEVGRDISSTLNLSSVMERIASHARVLLEADTSAIFLPEVDGSSYRAIVAQGVAAEEIKADTIQAGEGIIGTLAKQGKAEFINDTNMDPRGVQIPGTPEQEEERLMVAPLLTGDKVSGMMAVWRQGGEVFAPADLEFLQGLSLQAAIAIKNAQLFAEVEALKTRLQAENRYLQEEIKLEHNFEDIIGRSAALTKVLRLVEQVAATDATVLILGETGTGKELVARAVHHLSARRQRPLVKVNCAALPAPLLESELFGHERGAFTGATAQRIGRFELAHGGTIFLDEIGELPLESQVKLLRVLQDGDLERVGGSRTVRVDVRVIAATNRRLDQAIAAGTFREDLYYRLHVFPLTLPPLRERLEDLPWLVHHFVHTYAVKLGKRIETIPQAVMDAWHAHPWPGNVREMSRPHEMSRVPLPF